MSMHYHFRDKGNGLQIMEKYSIAELQYLKQIANVGST